MPRGFWTPAGMAIRAEQLRRRSDAESVDKLVKGLNMKREPKAAEAGLQVGAGPFWG